MNLIFENAQEKHLLISNIQTLISNIQTMEEVIYRGQRSDFATLWSMNTQQLRDKQEVLIPLYNEAIKAINNPHHNRENNN